MTQKDGRDRLWLIWKQPTSRRQYVIGEMERNGGYFFRYCSDIHDLLTVGFIPLMPFNDTAKEYYSPTLFPIFSSRLPDRKRVDIKAILAKYELSDEYDEYELLKASGARLPIDSFEFVDPIFIDIEGDICRNFFIAGTRHYLDCYETCSKEEGIIAGTELFFLPEPENQHDINAIKILNKDKQHIGYLPRYYSEAVLHYMEVGRTITCHVIERGEENLCDTCIRASLSIRA